MGSFRFTSAVLTVGCLLSLLCPISLDAAGPQLRARVIDKATGKPIANAEVSILGQPGTRTTDADGLLTWQPAPAPPFEILVILPGGVYARPVLVEQFNGDTIDVMVESLLTEAVTVAAGAAPHIESTPGSATTLVTSTQLVAQAPVTLAQALESVAGVSSASEGHAAVPVVRGFSAGRTLILLDGVRVSAERRAGPSATFLDPFSLDSVEVARGPGSVAYGSDAFGGVIYARTRRVAPGSPLAIRFTGAAGAGVSTVRGGVEVSQGFENGSLLLQAHAREAEDYRSPAGEIFNSGFSDQGFLGRFEHTLGPGTFSAAWQSDLGRDIERPRTNSRTVRFYYPTEDSHRLTASYELNRVAGFDRVSTTAFLGSYAIVTDQDRFATAENPRDIERADVSSRDFQVRVIGDRTIRAAHVELGVDVSSRFGLEAFEERVAFNADGAVLRTDRSVAVEDAHRTDVGLFATIQVPVASRALVSAGLRGDRVSTENRGGFFGDHASSNGAGSGFLSATIGSFAGFTLTGQVSRGFRDAVLSDRYFRGPTGRGFITGNPDLVPETSLQFDTALRYTAGRYRAAVYAFHYRIDDLIERFEVSDDNFLFRNRGRARMRGFEVETQADLGSGYTLELAGQITRGSALDDGAPLGGVPPASLSVQVRKQIGTAGFIRARGSAHARGERPGPGDRITPGYAVLDVGGGWTFSRALELRLVARNILDQEYLVSPDRRTVPAPGRSALLTVRVAILNP